MKRYELKIEVSQRGIVSETKTTIVTSARVPQEGESTALLVHPPIHETIVGVREIPLEEGNNTRYLVVNFEDKIQYLETAWTDDELKKSGFQPISVHPTKEEAALVCRDLVCEEGNNLIALFMGAERVWKEGSSIQCYNHIIDGKVKECHGLTYSVKSIYNDKSYSEVSSLSYHKKWDWLMPVVEKIEENYAVEIYGKMISIYKKSNDNKGIIDVDGYEDHQPHGRPKIDVVYEAVVEFINWHNKQK